MKLQTKNGGGQDDGNLDLTGRWQIFGALLIIGFIGGGFFWAASIG